jgi:hypothetical protein
MPIQVQIAEWVVLEVVVVEWVVIKGTGLLVATKMHMMVVRILVGICSLKVLQVDSHHMGHLLIVLLLLDMGMVQLATALVMVQHMEVMVVLLLVMVDLLLQRMGTQMSLMLLMLLVAQGVHGLLRLPLAMVLWVMVTLLLGVLQVGVLDLVQQLQVNLLVQLLDMGIKVMGMVVMAAGMVEVIILMGIQVYMVLLAGVLGVLQIVMLVVRVVVNCKVVVAVAAIWAVAMGMQMEILVMEMQHGDQNRLKHLVIMGLLREMVAKLVMVVAMVVLSLDKPNSSNFDSYISCWILNLT